LVPRRLRAGDAPPDVARPQGGGGYRHGWISTLCQQNVEMHRDRINKEFAGGFNIAIVFYSQIIAVAFGMDGKKDTALDCNMIVPEKLIDKVK
jgi:hypothetical protein